MNKTLSALFGLGLFLTSCGQPAQPVQPKPPEVVTPAPDPTTPDLNTDTTMAAPGVLKLGQTYTGVIAGQDRDHDYYIFDAAAGDQLKITVQPTSGSTLDPYVRLYLNDGWLLLEKDDDNMYVPSNPALNSEIRFNVPVTGRYAIEVTSFKLVNDPTATDNNPKNTYTIQLSQR